MNSDATTESINKAASINISNDTLSLIKIIALVSMLADHTNKFLLNSSVSELFYFGRLALPLFVFVLAYNLARPSMLPADYSRVTQRLISFGILATPSFIFLGSLESNLLPLNVLFTLALIAAVSGLVINDSIVMKCTGVAVALLGGALVEYWYPALLFGVGVSLSLRYNSLISLILAISGLAGICHINGNLWALASFLVILICLVVKFPFPLPRVKWFFYIFYPAHLALILLIQVYLESLGYMFI